MSNLHTDSLDFGKAHDLELSAKQFRIHSASNSFTWTNEDTRITDSLVNYSEQYFFDNPLPSSVTDENLQQIHDRLVSSYLRGPTPEQRQEGRVDVCKPTLFCDICCLVLDVIEEDTLSVAYHRQYNKGEPRDAYRMIKVWDGSCSMANASFLSLLFDLNNNTIPSPSPATTAVLSSVTAAEHYASLPSSADLRSPGVTSALSASLADLDTDLALSDLLAGPAAWIRVKERDFVALTSQSTGVLVPGSWLRLRQLRVYIHGDTVPSLSEMEMSDSGVEVRPLGEVVPETQVMRLRPYFKKHGKEEALLRKLSRASEALVLASPAPAIFCVRAAILSWFPTDLSNFNAVAQHGREYPATQAELEESPSPPGVGEDVFLFSLRIADSTASTDVIVFDKFAESFLGVTASQFKSDRRRRDRARSFLSQLVQNGTAMDFSVISYFVESSTPVDGRVMAMTRDLEVFIVSVLLWFYEDGRNDTYFRCRMS
eukprot:gene128-128_t